MKKPKKLMLADLRYTDARGRICEKIAPRVKRRGRGSGRGWNTYAPYDKEEKRWLNPVLGDNGGWDGGSGYGIGPGEWRIWCWLRKTSVKYYEDHTGAKGKAHWARVLERRKLKAVERKLDAAGSVA